MTGGSGKGPEGNPDFPERVGIYATGEAVAARPEVKPDVTVRTPEVSKLSAGGCGTVTRRVSDIRAPVRDWKRCGSGRAADGSEGPALTKG